MTSTTATTLDGAHDAPSPLISRSAWVWIVGLGVVFLLIHWTFLYNTSRIFTSDKGTTRADWSHIIAIPLIAGYYIYQKRDELRRLPAGICWWGLPILFMGLFSYVWWIFPGRNDMFRGYSMVVGLFGLVLLLGPKMMRVLWFPVLYMVFAVKVADSLWEQIAMVLQDIASRGAYFVLQLLAPILDFDIDRDGNTIKMLGGNLTNWYPMNVAEACSGLRMLMAFIALGVAMAFLFDRAWWQRIIMLLMAIPIALAVNIGRVTSIGVIALYDTEKATGDFHTFVGMLMLIPAFLMFLGLGWVLDRIIITDPEAEAKAARDAAKAESAAPPPTEPTVPAGGSAIARAIGVGFALVLAVGGLYWLLTIFAPVSQIIDTVGRGVASLLESVIGALTGRDLGLGRAAPAIGAAIRVLLIGAVVAGMVPVIRRAVDARQRVAVLAMAAALLVVWLVTQFAVIKTQKVVLVKDAVPLRHELYEISNHVGPWAVVHRDPPMSKDVEDALGTDKHLSWYFLDTRILKTHEIDGRAVRMRQFPDGAVLRVHLAYYTGGVDTVPHVPERCNVAGGFQAVGIPVDVPLDIGAPRYELEEATGYYVTDSTIERTVRAPELEFTARAFTYAPPGRDDLAETVVYFFVANGQFYSSPNQVRMLGFDLRDKHAYYFKVQVEALGMPDKEAARERVQELLRQLMPEIFAVLPDWVDVKEGRYPKPSDAPTTKPQS